LAARELDPDVEMPPVARLVILLAGLLFLFLSPWFYLTIFFLFPSVVCDVKPLLCFSLKCALLDFTLHLNCFISQSIAGLESARSSARFVF